MANTRLKLLKTAAKLFANRGFSGVGVRDIVQKAHVNIAAVHYHFGNKRQLYLATLHYLVEEGLQKIFQNGKSQFSADPQQLSFQQALQSLHDLLDKLVDLNFDSDIELLNQFIAQAEMQQENETLKILLEYANPLSNLLRRILARLTGLKEESPHLQILTSVIVAQTRFSKLTRLAILENFGPQALERSISQRKEIIWQNTSVILKSYQEGKNHL